MNGQWRPMLVWATLLVAAIGQAGTPAESALQARDAWARATPPGSSTAAVYLTIRGGATTDRLVAASTARAAVTQIHAVTTGDAGLVSMRPVEGVEIAASSTVTFAPQGRHLMLMGVSPPLVAGERFVITLEFASAGRHEVTVEIVPPTAPAPR